MMHRKTIQILALAVAASSALLAGCGEDEPPPPPPVVRAPEPPPPPPPPKVPTIKELMVQLDIDPRVVLPEERAPETEAQRVAVLKFFDAFVRGNSDGLRTMLSAPDQFLLDEMVKSGSFAKSTGACARVDVRCGTEQGNTCTLAVFHVGESNFEPQLWVYNTTGSTPEFDSVACPPGIIERLSGDNWIAAWYEILRIELAKADEPDEQPEMPKQDFTQKETAAPDESSGGGDGKPSGAPGRRMPGAPIRGPGSPLKK